MMRFCLLWVLLLTSNLGVMSQTLRKYLISGVVLDSVSNPVDYSTVILSTPDGRSVNYAVTDTSGCFRLENTVPGKYQLTISNIAYKTRNIPLEIIDRDWFAKIVLEKGTLITEDVVITASRIKRKSDGYVVSFQNNPLTSGKNAAEAIGYLPSVKAIGGSFMIQGQPVSRIRINGMTISDPKELEALQAENI
ncbi:MAG TPA: carboxypeptidase-like regulatory domain-containing protein, partial [Candidatus Rikenella faecigallinarum]|nr:carboxypeptidase-like regulatory domain-containing protein [Candidatus Rikenella faecigallinarum]